MMEPIRIGEQLAYSAVFVIVVFFSRLVLNRHRALRYVKTYHRDYWEANINKFRFSSHANISQLTEGLDDPKIEDFKKGELRALKQLLLAVVLIFLLFFVLSILRLI